MSGLSEEEWEAARELISCLAHDLNNFLSPLCLYGEVLEESLADPVQKQKATVILRRSESMKELIASARLIYKEEDGEAFQAEAFARRLAVLTRSSFQAKGVNVFWVLPKQAAEITGEIFSGRFRLAIWARRLAAEIPYSGTALILLNAPAMPVFARLFSGAEAEAAARRFRLEESAITALDEAAIENLLASLAKCKYFDFSSATG
jgi:hypothetical protein